ncbi:hypothetical protein QBC37DRAFT_393431, partial [Rhypophila decipiens]
MRVTISTLLPGACLLVSLAAAAVSIPTAQDFADFYDVTTECGSCFVPNATTLATLETEHACKGYTMFDVCVHRDPPVEMKYTQCMSIDQQCITDKCSSDKDYLLKLNHQHTCPDVQGITKHYLEYCGKQGVAREDWSYYQQWDLRLVDYMLDKGTDCGFDFSLTASTTSIATGPGGGGSAGGPTGAGARPTATSSPGTTTGTPRDSKNNLGVRQAANGGQ